MTLLYNLLNSTQKMNLNRAKRVMREGSPKYHYDVGAIAATANEEFEVRQQFPRSTKYEPLDNCLVINNDAVNIAVEFNRNAVDYWFIVPAGTIRNITREEVAGIWSVRITNLDAATAVTVDLIDIELSRAPENADSIARLSI